MKVVDSTSRAYRLNGNAVSETSMAAVLNAAYAMLASNDEIVPPFEDWGVEELSCGTNRSLDYFTTTDTGKELRLSFSKNERIVRIMLLSREDECFVDDQLLCTILSPSKYAMEEWL